MAQPKVTDYIDEFVKELIEQLESDAKRWGDTWLQRGLKGQEKRTMERYRDYYDQFKAGSPMPWMKIIGGALICWIREKHPEIIQCDPNDSCESINI